MTQLQPASVFWEESGMESRPFDNDEALAVEVVVPAEIEEFVFVFNTVEVEMKNRQATAEVFLHEGKSGAGDFLRVTETFDDALRQACFSCAEVSDQGNDLSRLRRLAQLTPQRVSGGGIGKLDRKLDRRGLGHG